MKIFSFENLEVWKDAKTMFMAINGLTASFPSEEKYNITSQIRRSSFSVCCNIAEGSSRWSEKEKSRYLEIAFGSLMETLNSLIIANEMNLIPEASYLDMRNQVEMIANKINALNSYFKQKAKK